MSYLNQAQDPRRRATAITGTLAIHVALGVAVVTGMTVTGFVPEKDGWNPFTVTPDPQPKQLPPEPQPEQQAQQSVITLPPTPLAPLGPTDNAVVPDAVIDRTTVVTPIATGGSVPDSIQASLFTPRRAVPANNANRWITTEDYPSRPLRAGIEGTGAYRLVVGSNGSVSACNVTRSTGNAQLDAATCRFIIQRARFEPATDETGARVIGSYTGTVRWEIPD